MERLARFFYTQQSLLFGASQQKKCGLKSITITILALNALIIKMQS